MVVHRETALTKFFDKNGVLFVESTLGVRIKIVLTGWNLISEIKHPELSGKLLDAIETLKKPNIVLRDKKDASVFHYHRKVNGKYLRLVCKHYNDEGFLITAHYIRKPKGGKVYAKN